VARNKRPARDPRARLPMTSIIVLTTLSYLAVVTVKKAVALVERE
jgi:hypothetical protein